MSSPNSSPAPFSPSGALSNSSLSPTPPVASTAAATTAAAVAAAAALAYSSQKITGIPCIAAASKATGMNQSDNSVMEKQRLVCKVVSSGNENNVFFLIFNKAPVHIDVGGTIYTSSLDTLTKYVKAYIFVKYR